MSDRAGSVLTRISGGVYLFPHRGRHRRVTIGRVNAVSAHHFLVTECDKRAYCARILVSRATGKRRTLSKQHFGYFATEETETAIAPDGSIAVNIKNIDDDLGQLGVTNLDTGSWRLTNVYVQKTDSGPNIVFSPDGEWLFGISPGDDLAAIDTDTFRVHDLDVPLPATSQLAIRGRAD